MFADLTFLSPWLLGALAAVPVLWWLLRVMPPRPRIIKFPAFFLLKDLATDLKSAAHTPWWLLLVRALVVVLFIAAFADPVMHPSQGLPGGTQGNVLVMIDNGWAAASGWQKRMDKLDEYLRQIRRSGRTVVFLPTAPSAEDGHVHSYGPMTAAEAEGIAGQLKPQPWPADYPEALDAAHKVFGNNNVTYAVFLSAGLAAPAELLKLMQTVVKDDSTNDPYILRQNEQKFSLERLHADGKPVELLAWSDDGRVLDRLKVNFAPGATETSFVWDMLPDVRNKTSRLALREPVTASSAFLVNARWRQHPVGILAGTAQRENRDFLNEVYYLRRALEANGDVTIDTLENLSKSSVSALLLADSTPLTSSEKTDLLGWVQQGGFLIRFAGPNLAASSEDALVPVPLRYGQRAMEGAMTWEKPVHLGEISAQSPLYGLSAPQDVTVTRQVLADPLPEVFEKTWLQLEDGTPLITGGRIGKGTVVLIHTSAGPEWSNFCYSGLYVEALQRMVALSNGINTYKAQTTLPPLLLLDGFGRLNAADNKAIISALKPDQEFTPSPQTPPGIYGDQQEFKAFNLGDHLPKMNAMKDIPADVSVTSYQKEGEIDLKPALIEAALLLLLADTLLTFWMRGVAIFAAMLLAMMIFSHPASAAVAEKDAVSGLYLAYIDTGDAETDRVSANGLAGLGEMLGARTTVKVKGVTSVNPEKDNLSYYPLIYWPMTERQDEISATAARNIQHYLSQGGMILFDTRDRQFGSDENALGARRLRRLTQNIQIPELTAVPKNHILTRSFYLLEDFPGRYGGGKVWVEKEPNARHDAVTSVVIGASDWAAAWSKDANDRARLMVDGGEHQREMAYRFGINLVMVALTGNYKADQVHIPYILERLGP